MERQNEPASAVKLEKSYRSCRRNRQGAAAVEFALVAPVFFLMIFGMIEFGRAIMVQQILTNATREGARIAILDSPSTTHNEVIAAVTTYLQNGSVPTASATITISPTEPTAATVKYGDPVTVTVTVPYSTVRWLPGSFFFRGNLTAKTVMRRETVQ